MIIILGLIAIYTIATYTIAGATSGVWPGKSIVLRLHPSYQRLYLYDGQHSFNEPFFTYVYKFDPSLTRQSAWRYVDANIGPVRISDDGTAYYCGWYHWKLA